MIQVYISYWIQSGLAILGSLFVIWWGWGVYYCCFIIHSVGHGHRAGKEYAQRVGAKLGNKRLPSIMSALIEFQKAQCFFMLAINIAAQINRGTGGFQPSSLQQLYNNYILIQAISISGFLPITLTLFTLHTVDMVSWYVTVLSVLTVGISVATLVDIGDFSPTQKDMTYISQQAATGGPSQCANTNLLVYCLNTLGSSYGNTPLYDSDAAGPTNGAYSILAFCLVVLVLLILDQASVFKKLSDLQKPALFPKTRKFLITNFVGIRGFQLLLVALIFVSQGFGECSARTLYAMLKRNRICLLSFSLRLAFLSGIHFRDV